MNREFIVAPCSGLSIDAEAGNLITVIDIDGGQVVDFYAEVKGDSDEFLSTGVTIDCNESLRLSVGDYIYSNLYRPLFRVIADDVGVHDLLHPCCRPEMYEFFYRNGDRHPNCYENINNNLLKKRPIIHPLNLFMNTQIASDGTVKVMPPKSKAGDSIVLQCERNMHISVAACSVKESDCNSRKCTAAKIIVRDDN